MIMLFCVARPDAAECVAIISMHADSERAVPLARSNNPRNVRRPHRQELRSVRSGGGPAAHGWMNAPVAGALMGPPMGPEHDPTPSDLSMREAHVIHQRFIEVVRREDPRAASKL